MRGKLCPGTPSGLYPWITPACAGKTKQEEYIYGDTEDHPRVCGENPVFPTSVSGTSGSPPRVRGKHIQTLPYINFSGITPACAGKTPKGLLSPKETQDHPRVCGENL